MTLVNTQIEKEMEIQAAKKQRNVAVGLAVVAGICVALPKVTDKVQDLLGTDGSGEDGSGDGSTTPEAV